MEIQLPGYTPIIKNTVFGKDFLKIYQNGMKSQVKSIVLPFTFSTPTNLSTIHHIFEKGSTFLKNSNKPESNLEKTLLDMPEAYQYAIKSKDPIFYNHLLSLYQDPYNKEELLKKQLVLIYGQLPVNMLKKENERLKTPCDYIKLLELEDDLFYTLKLGLMYLFSANLERSNNRIEFTINENEIRDDEKDIFFEIKQVIDSVNQGINEEEFVKTLYDHTKIIREDIAVNTLKFLKNYEIWEMLLSPEEGVAIFHKTIRKKATHKKFSGTPHFPH